MAPTLRQVSVSGVTTKIRVDPIALASGADGSIHLVRNKPDLIAKLYHEPEKDPARLNKLRAMLVNPPNLPVFESRGRRYIQIAWPEAWLENREGRCVGYIMPLVDLTVATSLENLLVKKTRTAAALREAYGFRLAAAVNLATLVAELHAHGHHIIDLKPINLHVYTDAFKIAVLDCDGFSVHGPGGERFPAHQFSDGYICPEALQQSLRPQDLGEDQDRFALAVILFQLLNQGIHPYQGVPAKDRKVPATNGERIARDLYAYGHIANPALAPSPWSLHDYFDNETRDLFDRAFTSRHDRPSAREWQEHLYSYADIGCGKLQLCAANPEHVRFYRGCPWCALEDGRRPSSSATENDLGQQIAEKGATIGKHWRHAAVGLVIAGAVGIGFIANWALRELENPIIDTKRVRSIPSDGRYDITVMPRKPSAGDWELLSLKVNGAEGNIEGRVSGFTFRSDQPFSPEHAYTVSATLRYTTWGMSREFSRQWESVVGVYHAAPVLTTEWDPGTAPSRIQFSANSKWVYIGGRHVDRFSLEETENIYRDHDFSYYAHNESVQRPRDFRIARDGDTIALLTYQEQRAGAPYLQIHDWDRLRETYGRKRPFYVWSSSPLSYLTVQNFTPYEFALSENGTMRALVASQHVRIYG